MTVYATTMGGGAAVTPSDTAAQTYAALYVGAGGNLSVEMESGATLTFVAVPTGAILPIRVRKVRATGTTATSIVGLN